MEMLWVVGVQVWLADLLHQFNCITMMLKKYAIQLSYSVSDEEKEQADKCLSYFNFLTKELKKAEDHLDLIYRPFKDGPNILPEQSWKARAALWRFRDANVEMFNKVKKISFKCFSILNEFSSDSQVVKLNKSFVLAISDIEKQVNRFADLFSDLKSKEFGASVIKSIENIKKEIAQIQQIIEDRIMSYIEDNILNRTWVDGVSKELQQRIEDKIPESIRMVQEREKMNSEESSKQ